MQGRLSLRERLVIVMVIALLPVAAISFWIATRESRAAAELTQTQVKFAASLLASHQARAADAAEQMLGAIAEEPQLLSMGRAPCQAYFESLRNRFPMYTNIGLLALDGHALCHAQGARGDASGAGREYFLEAIAQRRFVMGGPIEGRVTGRRALPFALPVMGRGEPAAVVFATLDLTLAATALGAVNLPPGAQVVVGDRHGNALMAYPALPAAATARILQAPAFLQAARSSEPSVGEAVDASGAPLIEAFATSRPIGPQRFVVRVAIEKSAGIGGLFADHGEALWLVGFLLLAATGATWALGGRMIVKPARQILGAARRIEEGNLDARVPLLGNTHRGEFARIAAAFNLMAESLQLRQADLRAELGRSRAAYDVLDQVLNSMQEGLVAVTASGQFLLFNSAATQLLPMEGAPSLPQLWPGHFGIFHADGVTPCAAEDLPLVRSALGEGGQAQFFVRNALVPQGRLIQCSWQPVRGDEGLRGGLVVFTDVTELQRLQAEQASQFAQLKETQRRLVEAQRVGRVGNWELDLHTGRLWWSDEVFVLFGVGPADFDGTVNAFMRWVHPDDRALLKPARDAALRDGEPMNVQYRVQRPDGSIAWMQEIAEVRRGANREPTWFGGVVQDVTQNKRAQADLILLRNAVARLNDIVIISEYDSRHGGDPRIVLANAAFERLLGHPARKAVGQTPTSLGLYGPRTDMNIIANMRAALRRGKAARAELIYYAHDGRELWMELDVVPMSGGGSTTNYLISVLRDVGARKATEQENAQLLQQIRDLNATLEARIVERTAELARQEQLYRTLAEQAPEVVWNTDGAGNVTYLNRAWYELVGGGANDWVGSGWLTRIHADDLSEMRANWLRSTQTLQPYAGIRRILGKDGGYHTMSYRAAPVLDTQGRVEFWVGIDADITEFKSIEQALRTSNQELEAFSYSVSHDLRAPLGAIAGFSRAVATRLQGSADERVTHYLDRIQAGVEKMEQLIEALLSLSKVARAPLEWGPVDLGAIARDTLEGLRMQEPEREVEVRVGDALLVQGDLRLLHVVLENLLGNAWKFSSRTTGAVIEVGRLPEGGAFFVRDNGVGFDMAYAGKLFNAFQRLHTDAEFPGTGIGLATVRRVILRHQGRVWAHSQPGEGTTFYFVLPETAPPHWLAADA